MAINERQYFGFRRTRGDTSRVNDNARGVPALLVPTTDRDLHFASAADELTDWNVANPTHPTLYIHSETTPATDYLAISHDGTDAILNAAGGNLQLQVGGNEYASLDSCTRALIINEAAADQDFRVEGDNNANLLVLDAGTDSIGLGGAVAAGAFINIVYGEQSRDIVSARGFAVDIPAETITIADAACTTNAIGAVVAIGQASIAATNAMNTITDAASLYIANAPTASGGNVTITTAHALWVDAGDTRLDGTTTLNTVTYTWPSMDGMCGQQLTTNGSGTLSWAAASLGEFKQDLGLVCTTQILNQVVSTPVHRFTYDPERLPAGQWAPGCEFIGVFGEEAPWAMQGPRKAALSLINSVGHLTAALQALARRVERLESGATV